MLQASAAKQLVREGVQISAGQNVPYIIQDAREASERSVLPSELINGPVKYDANKYAQLLIGAIAGLLSPLGYDKEILLNDALKSEYTSRPLQRDL